MTLEQTRQLGIEFERRVQTMIPETRLGEKLDTETIYSYLNQYQDKLIHDLYRTVDQIPVSNNQSYIEALLQDMMSSDDINHTGTSNTALYTLPNNFGLYIDSYSVVNTSYEYKGEGEDGIVPNTLIAAKDASKVLPKPQDSMRILRSPIVWLTEDHKLGAVYDRYTTPISIHIDYYRVPNYMDLMQSIPCELPMEMFDQLVTGAVDLYTNYVAGAESSKRQMLEQQKQQQKNNEE